jgi:hemerythrin superfamily protein
MQGITEFFQRDHREIDALYQSMLQAARAGDNAAALRFFDHYDRRLERHIEWEEKLLFPAFDELEGTTGGCGPTRAMEQDHRDIREWKSKLRVRLSELEGPAAPDDSFFRIASALTSTLLNHNGKEEIILYPMCDDGFPAAKRDAVLKQVRDESSRVDGSTAKR